MVGVLKSLASYRLHEKSETGHLGNNKLIQRLASDYLFQLKHFSENSIFDETTKLYFIRFAKHFIFNELIIGAQVNSLQLINKGQKDLCILTKDLAINLSFREKAFLLLKQLLGLKMVSKLFGFVKRCKVQ